MKNNVFDKDKLEADVDRFVEGLAAAGVTCDRDHIAPLVNLHHRSESFWVSLRYLAKAGSKWGVTFITFIGERNEAVAETLCSRCGFSLAGARFALNVTDAQEAMAT